MNYKLLSVSKIVDLEAKTINIGDYMQALASSQFLPRVDGFLDRDEDLKDYDGDECKMIMNGWYMHHPHNWPPSDKIKPLFVAFHINSVAQEVMLKEESIIYLKKHEPIGCRDLATTEMLKQKGVDAYFSGCMTLTLGEKYHSDEKDEKSYIVDPKMNCRLTFSTFLKACVVFIKNMRDVSKLMSTRALVLYSGRNPICKFIRTAIYYSEYKYLFGRSLVMDSVYINQDNGDYYKTHFKTDMDRLKEAERLINLYAKANLVITSRIHCALPCLGVETPVVFIEDASDKEDSKCRLGGLRELFNVVMIKDGKLKPEFDVELPITINNPPINKTTWKQLSMNLKERCLQFTNAL